eukprot:gene16091-30970_t
MTVSWLTAADNRGNFIMSINKRRESAQRLRAALDAATATATATETGATAASAQECSAATGSKSQPMPAEAAANAAAARGGGPYFVLSVPTAGMEGVVLAIGGCSGRDGTLSRLAAELAHYRNRVANLKRRVDRVSSAADCGGEVSGGARGVGGAGGVKKTSSVPQLWIGGVGAPVEGLVAMAACCAHLVCEVHCMTDHLGHWLTTGRVVRGYVRRPLWSGKTFGAGSGDVSSCSGGGDTVGKSAPPPSLLTFLGSKQFGHIVSPPSPV